MVETTRIQSLYAEALRVENGRRIMASIAGLGGVAGFSDIEAASGVRGSTLVYHLNKMVAYGLLSNPVKGTYELTYKTPLCYIYGNGKEKVAYLGLLGRREGRASPEPEVASRLLLREGMTVDSMHVVTSPDALSDWSPHKLPYQWILCYEDEIIDIGMVVGKVEPVLRELLRERIVVMDCTSATKPASLAFYQLAERYLIPLVYVYEERGLLRWLISREELAGRLGEGN